MPLKDRLLGLFMRRNSDFRCAGWVATICALLCSSCASVHPPPGVPKSLKIPGLPKFGGHLKQKFTMQINVSEGANQNAPIPMDLVMILDKKAVPEVAKLSSKDWFERRVQVERDHPGKIIVASWEWAPGEHLGPISVDVDPEFRAGFLFANYLNTSDHRAVIDVRAPIVVNLLAEDFSVMALK